MNVEDLRTFLCIVETKNFSRAGDMLFISQSAVTARIKALEKELHRQLFIRTNSSVELTMYGELFFRYAKNACCLLEEGARVLNHSAEYTSSLCIGAPDSVWQYNLFPFVSQLKVSNPDIALHLLCEHSNTLTSGLLDSSIDLAVVVAKPNQRLIHEEQLWESEFVLVQSPNLQLPDIPFSPETIHQFPFIQMFWGHPFHTWFEMTYQPNIFPYQMDRLFLYMDLLVNAMGIGFLPRRIAKSHLIDGTLREIPYYASEKAPHETGFLVCLQTHYTDFEPFMKKIREIFL